MKAAAQLIPNCSPELTSLEEEYLLEAIRSGWISNRGSFVEEFEKGLADYFGTRHACAVSSGTGALHLALAALGVGPGDEVIIPDLTYIAVANAVIYCGAVPVLADVHPEYWCLDPDRVAESVTRRTKAIVAVHGFGHPADMDRLMAIGACHAIPVVEDFSQAFGAKYKGRRVGGFGAIGITSLFANKIVTTGEGGALVTDDPVLHARVESLKSHCESPARKFLHTSVGFNYRMGNLHAAIGCAQLERIQGILERRETLLSWYREGLARTRGIRINPAKPWAAPVNWQVCVRMEEPRHGFIEAFRKHMLARGVEVRPNFVPLSAQPALNGLSRHRRCDVSRRLGESILMLPSGGGLSHADALAICAELDAWLS